MLHQPAACTQHGLEGASEAGSSWHCSTAMINHGTAFRPGRHVAIFSDDIRHRAHERVPVLSDLFPSGVTLIGMELGLAPFQWGYKQGRPARSLENKMFWEPRRAWLTGRQDWLAWPTCKAVSRLCNQVDSLGNPVRLGSTEVSQERLANVNPVNPASEGQPPG